jgi:DnaJ-class molecular chaperone
MVRGKTLTSTSATSDLGDIFSSFFGGGGWAEVSDSPEDEMLKPVSKFHSKMLYLAQKPKISLNLEDNL